MSNKMLRILSAICGAFVVLGIILNCVNFFCFQKSFYRQEYQKLDTAEQIGMSDADLQNATDALLDYLRGKRDDLRVQAVVRGQQREVFNQREILHMADVKTLYLWAMRIGNGLLILAVAFYLWAWLGKRDIKTILSGYLQGNYMLLGLIAALGIYAALDFNSFWTGFHKIFFTNDLWLLDPRTDILIQHDGRAERRFFRHEARPMLASMSRIFSTCAMAERSVLSILAFS
ncbi:MAG: TIGR01906 family membrane protein, partial [Clostridiales bacterium]|nr:TIGR01906 family membrane protein [Clostridiales bacterium]